MTGQTALVAMAIAVPLIFPTALPTPQDFVRIFTPTAPPSRPEKSKAQPKIERVEPRPPSWRQEPVSVPTKVTILIDNAPVQSDSRPYVVGSLPSGDGRASGDGVIGALFDKLANYTPVPKLIEHAVAAPPEPAPAPVIERVKLGGRVKQAVILHRVEPTYPDLALRTRVSGEVELEGVIGTDGRMKELRVLRGHPLLRGAALAAVSQWVYRPTTLNGDPVEVVAPITVTFRLN
jgi:protein TonB